MKKYILSVIVLIATTYIHAQDNSIYFYKPYPIFSTAGQVIIAGELNTSIYSNYFGKDVRNAAYTNAHERPENLVYELFRKMKIKDIDGIGKLYDTSFHSKSFDGNRMVSMLKDYTDIKFVSKFRSGDLVIVRYNFISPRNEYPYFAVIRDIGNRYYLTMNINITDPFNTIGSFSPYNLPDKPAEPVSTKDMTPFYFINKDNKTFFTTELPQVDYSALYLSFEFYNNSGAGPEIDFVKQMQQAARSGDSLKLKSMIAASDLSLLSGSYYSNYYYAEIKKIFAYSSITPIAAIKTNEGKVLYFKYSIEGQGAHIASIILKGSSGRYYLSFHISNDDINNVLQNNYVREAIYDYMKNKS
jgi:hypothetical protein